MIPDADILLDVNDRFPLYVTGKGSGLFAAHSGRKVTKQKYGSRFVLTQEALVINQRSHFGFSTWLGDGTQNYWSNVQGLVTAATNDCIAALPCFAFSNAR